MHWTGFVEIASDLVGFVSALYFCYPTYTLLANRRLNALSQSDLTEQISKLSDEDKGKLDDLQSELNAAEIELGKFDPEEYNYVTTAAALMVFSFGLKLIFHIFKP